MFGRERFGRFVYGFGTLHRRPVNDSQGTECQERERKQMRYPHCELTHVEIMYIMHVKSLCM
jgi:hypothetical protein